jgi:hypothetical protein
MAPENGYYLILTRLSGDSMVRARSNSLLTAPKPISSIVAVRLILLLITALLVGSVPSG